MTDGVQVLEGDGIPPADMLARLAEAEKVIDNREYLLTKEKELNERERTIQSKHDTVNRIHKDLDEKYQAAIDGCRAIATCFDFICMSKSEYSQGIERARDEEREAAKEDLQCGHLVADALGRESSIQILDWVLDLIGNANDETITDLIRHLTMRADHAPEIMAEAFNQTDSLSFEQWIKAMVGRLSPDRRQHLKDILK